MKGMRLTAEVLGGARVSPKQSFRKPRDDETSSPTREVRAGLALRALPGAPGAVRRMIS